MNDIDAIAISAVHDAIDAKQLSKMHADTCMIYVKKGIARSCNIPRPRDWVGRLISGSLFGKTPRKWYVMSCNNKWSPFTRMLPNEIHIHLWVLNWWRWERGRGAPGWDDNGRLALFSSWLVDFISFNYCECFARAKGVSSICFRNFCWKDNVFVLFVISHVTIEIAIDTGVSRGWALSFGLCLILIKR